MTTQEQILAGVHAQSARFRGRLDTALGIAQVALKKARRPYVAFSGGKDSTAVCALVHALNPAVPLLWSDSELELPETVDYIAAVKRLAGDQMTLCFSTSTHAGWFASWTDEPFFREPLPGTIRIAGTKDEWQRAAGFDRVFLGLRANESRKRRAWLAAAGPIYGAPAGVPRCCPIWDWTEDDVWALLHSWRLGYNPAYDRMDVIGVHRQRQRVGPLPLTSRSQLEDGWPDLLERLEARYGRRWHG